MRRQTARQWACSPVNARARSLLTAARRLREEAREDRCEVVGINAQVCREAPEVGEWADEYPSEEYERAGIGAGWDRVWRHGMGNIDRQKGIGK